MNKFLMGLTGFGAVLAAGAFYLQHATMAELRDEIAALRTDVQQVAKQPKDAVALTGMQVVGQQEIKPDLTAVRVRMQADSGNTKDETLAFYHAPDGWRMVLPQSFLEKQMGALRGGK